MLEPLLGLWKCDHVQNFTSWSMMVDLKKAMNLHFDREYIEAAVSE